MAVPSCVVVGSALSVFWGCGNQHYRKALRKKGKKRDKNKKKSFSALSFCLFSFTAMEGCLREVSEAKAAVSASCRKTETFAKRTNDDAACQGE